MYIAGKKNPFTEIALLHRIIATEYFLYHLFVELRDEVFFCQVHSVKHCFPIICVQQLGIIVHHL